MTQNWMERFARVLVRTGVNLQPGEIAVIKAPPPLWQLVRVLAAECYRQGARSVGAAYADAGLARVRAEQAKDDYLDLGAGWLGGVKWGEVLQNACVINLEAPFFEQMPEKPDAGRLARVQRAELEEDAPYRQAVADGRVAITKAVVPFGPWAKRVYPELGEAAALQRLTDVLGGICRLDCEDPLAAWEAHKQHIKLKKQQLDALCVRTLLFTGPGTCLSVGLVEGGRWIGGCAVNTKNGLEYVPNIPTEEIFFVPHRLRVEGVVASTLPLYHGGRLIEGIRLEVREGRVVNHSAQKGQDVLEDILEADGGASYFGEVSLVSGDSPIGKTGTVFQTTLLDENAACHLALGRGTPSVLPGGFNLSPRRQVQHGINPSSIHVDFMIGSNELNVDAMTAAGERVALMRGGCWAL